MFSKEKVKKVPTRKSPYQSCFRRSLDAISEKKDFGLEYEEVTLKLGNSSLNFNDGTWIVCEEKKDVQSPANRFSNLNHDEMVEKMQKLVEENNFLRLKIEILLNAIAEKKAMADEQETSTAD